jgi:hypothetical protein
MKTALFLGNSHVAALKVGYDQIGDAAPFKARFFCAPGADISFTEVDGESIVPAATSEVDETNLRFFFPDGGTLFRNLYLKERRPFRDVRKQFVQTGKTPEIELDGVSAIFYVAGTSPYDFIRLDESVYPVSMPIRSLALDRLLGSHFLLRKHIEAIRRVRPGIRHYFVGTPFRYLGIRPLREVEREVVAFKRDQIAAVAGNYLFEDVFMPPADLLEPNHLATKQDLFRNGRQEGDLFQGAEPAASDHYHVNGVYGRQVLERFVTPSLGF